MSATVRHRYSLRVSPSLAKDLDAGKNTNARRLAGHAGLSWHVVGIFLALSLVPEYYFHS